MTDRPIIMSATAGAARNSLPIPFPIYSKVHIDGDASLAAVIIGYWWKGHAVLASCSWLHNGLLQEGWVDVERLSAAE